MYQPSTSFDQQDQQEKALNDEREERGLNSSFLQARTISLRRGEGNRACCLFFSMLLFFLAVLSADGSFKNHVKAPEEIFKVGRKVTNL